MAGRIPSHHLLSSLDLFSHTLRHPSSRRIVSHERNSATTPNAEGDSRCTAASSSRRANGAGDARQKETADASCAWPITSMECVVTFLQGRHSQHPFIGGLGGMAGCQDPAVKRHVGPRSLVQHLCRLPHLP